MTYMTSRGARSLPKPPSTERLTSRLKVLEELLRDAESGVADLYNHEQTIARVKAQGTSNQSRYAAHLR